MDFIDPDKKRKNTIKLYIGYVLIAIAIVLASIVLLFYALGYGIGRSGSVVRNGLVFIDSSPDGADIKIEHNSKIIKQDKTNTRLNIPEGTYNVTLSKTGYISWRRSFHLDGGGIERMQYPFLFPEKLDTANVQTYSKPTLLTTSSPDRRWIVVQNPANFLTLDIYDGNQTKQEQKVRSINLPANLFKLNNKDDVLTVTEWSTDNKHVLLQHTNAQNKQFVMVNIEEPDKSISIDTTFKASYSNIKLRDKKFDSMYLLDASGNLLLGNTGDKSTKQLLTGVIDFKPHGADTILYVTKKTDQEVSANIFTSDKSYQLRALPIGTEYLLDLAQFDGAWYMAVGTKGQNQLYVYKNPLDWLKNPDSNQSIFARTMRVPNAAKVSFSNNAQFIALQGGQNFAVYDAENDRQFSYVISDALQDENSAKWMDGHRLVVKSNNRVVVFDYDGINKVTLSSILPGTNALFDRDYQELYTFAPTEPNQFALSRTELVIKQ